MQNKTAIGIVLYYPESSLIERVKMCSEAGYNVYLVDNSPEEGTVRCLSQGISNIKYITGGKNLGLGIGLSIICGQAFYDGYDYLVFFDQDTIFNLDCINFIDEYVSDSEDELSQKEYSTVVFNSKTISPASEEKYNHREVFLTISSGSLFVLKVAKAIGFHNINYSVDCVDYEYCYRSSNNGYRIGEVSNTPGFDHVTGQADKLYTVLGKKLMLRAYPLKRVWGTFSSSLRLVFTALINFNFRYVYEVSRSILIYMWFQFLVRVLNLFNFNNGK